VTNAQAQVAISQPPAGSSRLCNAATNKYGIRSLHASLQRASATAGAQYDPRHPEANTASRSFIATPAKLDTSLPFAARVEACVQAVVAAA